MNVSDFDFALPDELIAQHPPTKRGQSRLLVGAQPPVDAKFDALLDWLRPGDVLVFNNTRVMKARLFGQKETGGQIEALLERVLDEQTVLAHVRASKSPKPNTKIFFGDTEATVLERRGELYVLRFSGSLSAWEIMEAAGQLPLPPYITHTPSEDDAQRYQTVYAQHLGAVAAPTAGLHFTPEILAALKAKGVEFADITLHVGAGTFQPVRVDDVRAHVMHSEWFNIPEATAQQIRTAKQEGRRICAVGTTSLRALEAASVSGSLKAGAAETTIFITPGYAFKAVDVLLTNFHLPKSTLLMLVSAFAGFEPIRALYAHAIAHRYRFFSYGDAMLLFRQESDSKQ